MINELSRNVSLICPVCGNDQFRIMGAEDNELKNTSGEVQVQCSDCGAVFSKEEIIEENSEKIDIAIEELKDDIAAEIEKEVKGIFRRWK